MRRGRALLGQQLLPGRNAEKMLRALLLLTLVLSAGTPSLGAQGSESAPQPDGRLLRLGTDSLAIYLVRGTDTTRTGLVVDRLEVIEQDGRTLLQRAYHSTDDLLGSRIDTLVDVLRTLAPVRHRSRTPRSLEFLEFGSGTLKGWLRLANGDSVAVDVPLPATLYNSSSFDLVLRASPLSDAWRATVPALRPHTRTVVSLRAWVGGSDIIDGEATWRVEAEFTGLPVTFWIGKASRALRQQTMRIQPDVTILFAPPKAPSPAKRPST